MLKAGVVVCCSTTSIPSHPSTPIMSPTSLPLTLFSSSFLHLPIPPSSPSSLLPFLPPPLPPPLPPSSLYSLQVSVSASYGRLSGHPLSAISHNSRICQSQHHSLLVLLSHYPPLHYHHHHHLHHLITSIITTGHHLHHHHFHLLPPLNASSLFRGQWWFYGIHYDLCHHDEL